VWATHDAMANRAAKIRAGEHDRGKDNQDKVRNVEAGVGILARKKKPRLSVDGGEKMQGGETFGRYYLIWKGVCFDIGLAD